MSLALEDPQGCTGTDYLPLLLSIWGEIWVSGVHIKRGQTCTFQTCTLFSARILALTASRLTSMPSFPSPPLHCFHTKWMKVGNHEPQDGLSNAEKSRRTKCTFERCTFVTPWPYQAIRVAIRKPKVHTNTSKDFSEQFEGISIRLEIPAVSFSFSNSVIYYPTVTITA